MNRKLRYVCAAIVFAIVTTQSPMAAPPTQTQTEIKQLMKTLGVMQGYPSGDYGLSDHLTRAQYAKMSIMLSPSRYLVADSASVTSPFRDVPYKHWAASFVRAAAISSYMRGYQDGSFKPEQYVTVAEAVTVALHLLGYTDNDLAGAYPATQMNMADKLELLTTLTDKDPNRYITRGEVMNMIYALLDTERKQGGKLIQSLGYPSVVLSEMFANDLEGPITLGRDVNASLRSAGLDPTKLSLTRDGMEVDAAVLEQYDILYYSVQGQVARAYSERVTGVFENAQPNRNTPSRVTVDGVTYTLETDEARRILSTQGTYRYGDSVTLLMGESGVADVLPAGADEKVYMGVIIAAEDKTTNYNGMVTITHYITVLLDSGEQKTFAADRDYQNNKGAVIKVTYLNGSPDFSLPSRYNAGEPGLFDLEGAKLGQTALASDVTILESYNHKGRAVLPQRLDGVKLTASQVLYLGYNDVGAINKIVLSNATGDGNTYGLLLSKSSTSVGFAISTTYEFNIGGVVNKAVLNEISDTTTGPSEFSFSDEGMLEDITSLSKVKDPLSALSRQYLTDTSGGKYKIPPTLGVYYYESGKYTLAGLSDALNHPVSRIDAYYEKPLVNGGAVRILILR